MQESLPLEQINRPNLMEVSYLKRLGGQTCRIETASMISHIRYKLLFSLDFIMFWLGGLHQVCLVTWYIFLISLQYADCCWNVLKSRCNISSVETTLSDLSCICNFPHCSMMNQLDGRKPHRKLIHQLHRFWLSAPHVLVTCAHLQCS